MCRCTKVACKQPNKRKNCNTVHILHVLLCYCLIIALVFVLVSGIPVIAEALLITDKNVTGKLTYDIVENAIETDVVNNCSLQDTVFGKKLAVETREAIDNRAYSNALEIDYAAQQAYEEEQLAKKFYIADVTLEYPWEGMTFSYTLQKHTYQTCAEYGVDYWLVLGVIARESRFNANARGYNNGVTYYGYMQVNWDCVNSARKHRNDNTLDPTDPFDNIVIGVDTLSMQIDKVGNESGGLFAYGVGYGAYCDYVARGIYTDSSVKKAYKYRDLLMRRPRYSSEEEAKKAVL